MQFRGGSDHLIITPVSTPSTLLNEAARRLRQAGHVVVFTGAGASAESGVPTFRDRGGVWDRFPPEQFATPQGLRDTALTHPRRVAEFVLGLIEPIAAASPNAGHFAVARMARHARVTVVTQNIDGLHQDAGSPEVHEVHGSLFEIVTLGGEPLRRVSRTQLRQVVTELRQVLQEPFTTARALEAVKPILGIGACGFHRPNIVLFGEPMAEPAWTLAADAAAGCDCMLTVGASGAVFPAASLPEEAHARGAEVIAIGPERTLATCWLKGSAAATLPTLVDAAFGTDR